ncbi:MAG: hypothetical protein ACP5NW_06115 [Candidatus Woesearchaeota archaeon]
MSDSFRFAVYGTLVNDKNQNLFSGVFYVKEENGWKIYITDKGGFFGGDGAQPIATFGLNDNTQVTLLDYTPQTLMRIRSISIMDSSRRVIAILENLRWIADFVNHEHLPLKK